MSFFSSQYVTKPSRKISLRNGATAIRAKMMASSLKFKVVSKGRSSLLAFRMSPSRITTARYYRGELSS